MKVTNKIRGSTVLPANAHVRDIKLDNPKISIVVPTRNEADNIEPLLSKIGEVMNKYDVEVLFVDDSTDSTVETIRTSVDKYPFDIKFIARPPERRNGLGKAVVEGLQAVTGDMVVVMDGDLQHPPSVIPQLVNEACSKNLDIVIASRLKKGGSTDGLSLFRKFISYMLAFLSQIIFPQTLNNISDPMTGFFLLRRNSIDMDALQPEGFKILLEILCKNPTLKSGEIPFQFGERLAGESKANGQEMWRLFQQILRLRFNQNASLIRFVFVGLTGLVVNTGLLYVFTDLFKIHYLLSAAIATQGSTLWNFIWTERWVFNDREHNRSYMAHRVGSYYAVNNGLLLARIPFLGFFVSLLGMQYLIANVVTLGLMTLARYVVSDKLIWQKTKKGTKTVQNTYYYDIHGIIRVRSLQYLPELTYFKTTAFDNPDIDVKIVRNPKAHRTSESIAYDEITKSFGFSIVINRSDAETVVFASPLIKYSPHVLYTNVVEPLLRWNFVQKGYAMMHGASIAFGDNALFITARTDTGKTTTILYTIKSNLDTAEFLSDDMTIFGNNGRIFNYPKPLTISQHTIQAVGGAPLSRREKLFLKIQSRLHSREGRHIGMLLSDNNFPAATLSTIVQAIIPPPKFMVDKLVPNTKYTKTANLSHIVVIERGENLEVPINDQDKTGILLANAEDAYGFPPYPYLAEQLSSWQGEDLHKAERAIVENAVKNVPGTFIRDSNYGWYKRLPQLVEHMQEQPVNAEVLSPVDDKVTMQDDVSILTQKSVPATSGD